MWTKIKKELKERLIKSWDTTLSALLVLVALIEWKRGDITTEELISFVGLIGVIIGLLTKKKPLE